MPTPVSLSVECPETDNIADIHIMKWSKYLEMKLWGVYKIGRYLPACMAVCFLDVNRIIEKRIIRTFSKLVHDAT